MLGHLGEIQPEVEMFEPERISLSDSQRAELARMMEVSARNGAKQALREIGLHDDSAAHDVREMRDLLAAWRTTRQEMWRTVIRLTTTAVLGVIAAAVWLYSGSK